MTGRGPQRWCAIALALAGAIALSTGVAASGTARPLPSTRVSPEAVIIAIGNSPLVFGNEALGATVSCPTATVGACPTVTNNSDNSEDITTIVVTFTNDPEATCGAGWQGHASTVGTDQFVLDVAINGGSFVAVAPGGGGSGDIESGTLAPSSSRTLNTRIHMPSATTTGSTSCSIALTVTASL